MTQEFLIKLCADYAIIPVVLIGALTLIIKVPKGQRLQAYSRVLMAGLTAYLLSKLIGLVYQPESLRPFEVLGTSAGASFLNNAGFPSDHVLFVTAITLAVWFETRQKTISIILAILTIAICVGRVLALVHTPIDIIGGIAIAAIGALWYVKDDHKYKVRT